LLKAAPINFKGNVEGHDIFETALDVIVCDGFTGNVVLKTAEATAKIVFKWVKAEISAGGPLIKAWKKLGGGIIRPYMQRVKEKGSYDTYWRQSATWDQGTLIIAHGSSSPSSDHERHPHRCGIRETRSRAAHRAGPSAISKHSCSLTPKILQL